MVTTLLLAALGAGEFIAPIVGDVLASVLAALVLLCLTWLGAQIRRKLVSISFKEFLTQSVRVVEPIRSTPNCYVCRKSGRSVAACRHDGGERSGFLKPGKRY